MPSEPSLSDYNTISDRDRNTTPVTTDSHTLNLQCSLILQTCFLYPLKGVNAQHLYYLILHVAEDSRLKLDVFEWWTQSPLKSIAFNSTALLPSYFSENPPLFLIPVPHSDGCVVIVTSTCVVLLKLPDILSGRLDYTQAQLPSFPVAYYQERFHTNASQVKVESTQTSSTYTDMQYIYIATESNIIFTIAIDATNDQLSVQPLVDLETSIGSSLIISPCSESGASDFSVSVNDAAYLMIHTAGDGVLGGTFFVRSTEDGVLVDYLSEYQSFGPVCDALLLNPSDAFDSISPNFDLTNCSELFVSSGVGPSSSALVHIRQGLKASVALEGLPVKGVKHLFSATSNTASFLLASYPYYTNVFRILDGDSDSLEIVDFAEQSKLNLQTETLAFGAFNDCLIQVTPSSLIVSNISDQPDKLTLDGFSIFRSHISQEHIALVFRKDNALSLALYKISPDLLPSSDALQLLGETSITDEITMLKIIPNPKPLILLGTFTSVLQIFTADSNIGSAPETIDLPDIANDVISIGDTLLIGLRSGSILYYRNKIILNRLLGKLPVQFFQGTNNEAFAVCDFLYFINPALPLDIPYRVVIEDSSLLSVQAACMFPVSSATSDNGSELVLAAAINHKLNILVVEKNPSVITRRIPIRAVPRRILYMSHIGMIVVLFLRSCKTSRKSHLRFVDPQKGVVVTPNEDYDTWKPKTSRITDEVMYCATEWEFRVNGSRFKYLVVGSGGTEYNAPCGFIYVMTVSKTKSGRIDIQKRFALQEEEPVLSVAQIDQKTLICATAKKLVLFMLLVEDQKCKILKLGSIEPVAGPVINVTVRDGLIYAGTLKNSIYVYQYNNETGTLRLLCSDGVLRASLTQCVLDDGRTLVVSDKQRNVAFYEVSKVNSDDGAAVQVSSSTLKLLSSIMFPTPIIKLIPVSRENKEEDPQLQVQDVSQRFKQDILAIGIDGSVYKLLLLTEKTEEMVRKVIVDATETLEQTRLLNENEEEEDEDMFRNPQKWRESLLMTKRVIDWDFVSSFLSHDPHIRTISRLGNL